MQHFLYMYLDGKQADISVDDALECIWIISVSDACNGWGGSWMTKSCLLIPLFWDVFTWFVPYRRKEEFYFCTTKRI